MKRYIIILVLITFTGVLWSQSWKASNKLAGSGDVSVIESTFDAEGNIYVFGYFTESLSPPTGETFTSLGQRDYFLIKYYDTGEAHWAKHIGGPSKEYVDGGIIVSTDNYLYVTGSYRNYVKYSQTDSLISTGGFDSFVAKYDLDGGLIWINNMGAGNQNQRTSAITLDNDNLLVGGFFSDSISIYADTTLYSNDSFDDYYYAKFKASDGSFVWAKQIKAISNAFSGYISDIEVTADSYFFSGQFADSIIIESDTLVSFNETFDIHLFKTDLFGNLQWIRTIKGNKEEYSYSMTKDPLDNLYLSGYYDSDSLIIQTNESDTSVFIGNQGRFDFVALKYSSSGDVDWYRANGGKGDDKLFDSKFYNNELVLAGYFSDTIKWGGIELSSNGPEDKNMFIGNLDIDGNYRSANSFEGRNNSWEESWGVFDDNMNLFTVIRSNSDLLVLGDSIYTSSNNEFYIVLGIVGCLPISIDQVITQDVQTCNGDSTGAIQILTSGGFGAPWQYSIDNGLSYQDAAYFGNLPAGDYPLVVIDAENCAQPGPLETVNQPEPLSIELISDVLTADSIVEIVVAVYGGTPPYTYTLQPNGIVQGFGDFSVKWSEPGYYIVEVTDLPNCGPVATDTLTTSNELDLFAPGVKLYPNPTSGIITVEVPFQGSACTLEVLNLTGQVMFSRQVYSNGISINETIDLSDLSKGMYMIRVDGQTLRSGVVLN